MRTERLERLGRFEILSGAPANAGTNPVGTAAGRSGWFQSGISDKMSSSGVVKTHMSGFGVESDGRTRASGARRLGSIPSTPTKYFVL